MKRIQLLFLLGLLAGIPYSASGQSPSQAASLAAAARELRQMWNDLSTAARKLDRVALERIYSENVEFVHANSGGVVNRDDHIRPIVSSAGETPELQMPDFDNIMLFGDVAILRNREPNRFDTSIYVKKQGRWQLLQVQGTPMPRPRRALTISPSLLTRYAGKYDQSAGSYSTITVEGNGLRVVFANNFVWNVQPMSESQFFSPDSLNQIMFHMGDDGRVRYYTAWLSTGYIVKANKVDIP